MSIKTPLPLDIDPNLYQIFTVILQKAVDGTRDPIKVDEVNNRVYISGTLVIKGRNGNWYALGVDTDGALTCDTIA